MNMNYLINPVKSRESLPLKSEFFKFRNYEEFFKFGIYRNVWKANALKFLIFEYIKKSF